MNLETLKNNYAQEQGYEDWENLIRSIINHVGINGRYAAIIAVEKHMNEICIRSQKAALEKAAENVKMGYTSIFSDDMKLVVDRKSITNPENLIR